MAVEVRIRGRVQGVFFRASARDEAHRLGIAGWVSNEPDGSVAGHFEGPQDAVEQMVAWCRTGPPQARVREVEVYDAPDDGRSGFDVR